MQKQKQQISKKNYYYKDDEKVAKFELKNFKFQGQELKLNLKLTPLKDVVRAKKFGKTSIPFSCSLRAARMVIPDKVA